jgi:hypothetical protein
MRIARVLLILAGSALGLYGAVLLVTTLPPASLLALAVWLVGVLVVHDAVLAPATSAIRSGWWRHADERPRTVTAAVQVGFAVGAVLSLFVLPEIWAQSRGSANPTILVGDYVLRLAVVWAAIAAVVLVIWRTAVRRARRPGR